MADKDENGSDSAKSTNSRTVTTADIIRLIEDGSRDGFLFRCGDDGLIRHLIAPYYSGKVFQASSTEVRKFVELLCPSLVRDAPVDDREFFAFVRRRLLSLRELPRDTLLELYDQASKDLATIAENIAECRRRFDKLSSQNRHVDEYGWNIEFYKYLEEKNVDARNEIVDMLATRVKDVAYSRAFDNKRGVWLDVPYTFAFIDYGYHPNDRSELRNKLGHVAWGEWAKWEQVYRENRTEFKRFLDEYLKSNDPISAIQRMMDSHHRLAERKVVLHQTLNALARREYGPFCHTVVAQIEGIFDDLRDELAAATRNENNVRASGLFDKLRLLREHVIHYDYFAYRFTVIRNDIAHGRFRSEDPALDADLLLLDLCDVCELLCAPHLPLALAVNLVRSLEVRGEDLEPIDLIKFHSIRHIKIPLFYGIDGVWKLLDKKKGEPAVLAKLEELVERTCTELVANELKTGLAHIAMRFNRKDLLQKLEVPTPLPKIDLENFWSSLG